MNKNKIFSLYKQEPVNQLLKDCPTGMQSKLINDTIEKYQVLIKRADLSLKLKTASGEVIYFLKECFKRRKITDLKMVQYINTELSDEIFQEESKQIVDNSILTDAKNIINQATDILSKFVLFDYLSK